MIRTITVTLCLVIPPLAGCQSMSEKTDAISALSALPEDAEQLTPREVGDRAPHVSVRNVDDDTNQMLHGYGINLEDASGRPHRVLPVPAVYLIDRSGVIQYAHWDANYRERLSADEVLEAAHRLVARK